MSKPFTGVSNDTHGLVNDGEPEYLSRPHVRAKLFENALQNLRILMDEELLTPFTGMKDNEPLNIKYLDFEGRLEHKTVYISKLLINNRTY